MRVGLLGKIVGGVVLLLLVLVGAAAAVLMTLDVNRFKDLIAEQVEAATGRAVTIGGKMELEIGMKPTISLAKVTLANAPWGQAPSLVSVGRFSAELDLMAALAGDIQVKRLILRDTTVSLEVKGEAANWELGEDTPKPDTKPATKPANAAPANAADKPVLPGLAVVRLDNVTLTYGDLAAGTSRQLHLESLLLKGPSPAAPVALEARGKAMDIPFDITGTVGPLADLAGGGKPYPLALKGLAAGVTFTADGTVKNLKAMKGIGLTITAQAGSLSALKSVATALPDLPAIHLSTKVADGARGSWKFTDLDLSVGGSKVTGAVTLALAGKRPALDAKLAAPLVDLRELLPEAAKDAKANRGRPGRKSPGGVKGEREFSDAALDLDGLKAVDARFDLEAGKVILPNGLEFADLSAKGSLNDGKLALKPFAMTLGGGKVTAVLDLDASAAKRVGLKLDLDGKAVNLGALFQQIGQSDLLTGAPTDLAVTVAGEGASEAGILASLDGPIRIEVGQGRINNALLDWAGADVLGQLGDVISGDKSDHAELVCAVINTRAKDGVLTWDKQIAVQTSKMNVVSSGSLALKSEALDVAVRPYARDGVGVSAGKLAEMVRLQGTLGDPKLGVDAEGVARTALSVAGALATGGGSLLAEGLVEKDTFDPTPCATALGKAPARQDRDKDERKEPASPASAPAKLLDGVTKGLLGR